MKSKKSKPSASNSSNNNNNTTISNKSDDHRTSALSFLKNRLFSSSSNESSAESLPSTSSSRPISHRSPLSIDIPKSTTNRRASSTCDRPISKSFEEPSFLEASCSNTSGSNNNPRPVSMMMGLHRTITGDSSDSHYAIATASTSAAVVKRRRPPDDNDEKKRTSFIVIKEGYLYKKADFRAFHKAHNHRGWKLYRIVLRGHKLYLYKLSSESPLRSLVSSPKHHRQQKQQLLPLPPPPFQQQQQQQQQQLQKQEEEPLVIHHPADLFNNQQLRDNFIYGATFINKDQHRVGLLIFTDMLIISTCITPRFHWQEDCRIPLDKLQVEKRGDDLILTLENGEQRVYTSISVDVQSAWMNAFESQGGLPRVTFSKEDEEQRLPTDDTQLRVIEDTSTSGRRIVQGGTVGALIHELLVHEPLDKEYMNAFLLTFPMFTSTATVLDIFKAYVSHTPHVCGRLVDIFQVYCTHFTQDVVGEVANGMISILETLEASESVDTAVRKRSAQTKEMVLATVTRNGDEAGAESAAAGASAIVVQKATAATMAKTYDDDNDDGDGNNKGIGTVEDIPGFRNVHATRRPSSVNLSNMLITGLTPSLFLTIDPQSFAEQIYWFHLSQHRQHETTLTSPLSYVPRPQTSPQVINSLVFTTASPHFLTKLIRHHILIDSQQEEMIGMENDNTTLTRTFLLEHWIQVGIALTKLGDMPGWCAVATGICSLGVIRLKESWKSVNRSLVATVTQHWVGMLAEYGFFAQDMWIDGWEKNAAIDAFARIMDPPRYSELQGLPFFGTLRQAVDRLRKHLKDEDDSGKGTVNFQKYRRIYDAVRQSLGTWKALHKRERAEEEGVVQASPPPPPPSFKVVGPLQAFFEHSVTDFISVPHDFKYLQECSLACEPRIFGQSYDRHRKFDSLHGTDVAPPSSATLTFPEVLEGYTLFHSPHHHHHHHHCQDTSSLTTSPRSHVRKKGSSHSIKSDEPPGTPSSATTVPRPAAPEHARLSPRVTNRKMFRRRTYSFPPGGAGSAVVGDTETINSSSSSSIKKSEEYSDSYLDSLHSKTWLGSLISHRHGSYSAKAILDAVQRKERGPGDWMLIVENGNLILKASTLVQADDSVTKKQPLKKSTSSGFLALAEKGSSGIRSRSGTINSMTPSEALQKDDDATLIASDRNNKDNDNNDGTPIFVNVKAGRLERLVDILVNGVSRYNRDMREQWQFPTRLLEQEISSQHLALDEEEYTNVFFVTYRSFCSVVELLELLREMFTGAVAAGRHAKQQKTSTLESVFQTTPATATRSSSSTTNNSSSASSSSADFDWRTVASIQLRVVNLMLHWVEEHFYDFVDEIEILNHVGRFLQQAQDALGEWRSVIIQQQQQQQQQVAAAATTTTTMDQHVSLATAAHIDRQLQELRKQFIHKILSPSYDLKAIDHDTGCSRKVDELYKQLTSGTQGFRTTIAQGTRKSMAFSLSAQHLDDDEKAAGAHSLVDQQSAAVLLKQADQCVRQLFASVTLQDWIQTFDVFEAQSSDLYAWLPSHKASQTPPMSKTLSPVRDAPTAQPTDYHIPADDVMVSDIFTAIEGARRSIVSPSAFSADDLLLAFPSSIQYLYCMHFIIRSWVIHEITPRNIDFQTRVQRIDKFLHMVVLSKSATERMALFPELRDVEDRPRRVPGFVEYAIASALISPEVRLFSRAWMHVARRYGQMQLDTLESLLSHVQRTVKADSMVLVPSVGWVFDRMLELCAAVPDTYNHNEHMINFDKRRYVFHFLQLVMNAQMDLEEQQQQQQQQSVGLDGGDDYFHGNQQEGYLSFIICPDVRKSTWKELKDCANKENKQGGGSGSGSLPPIRSGSTKSQQGVFSKLVSEQLEKLKRDIKERDRIDKEWRDLQHKLQKRQIEQARYLEKQERKSHKHGHQQQQQQQYHHHHHHHHHLPKLNSFFRGFRPTLSSSSSSASSSTSSSAVAVDPTYSAQFQTAKASTVINLIHSTTSVASAYTKRDHVFRIVTEEGGQYLFQATNWEDMHDWMQQINNAAREGAVKRRSVLASDSNNNNNNNEHQRNSRFCEEEGCSSTDCGTSDANTRKSVYGVDLVALMDDGSVPLLAEKCIAEIERRGLEEVGIYRTAGTGSVVEQLKAAFNSDMSKVDLSDPQWADINVVADAFKQFLRNIPGSLMTHTYYDEFIHAAASEDHDQRVYLIKQVLQKLPDPNYTLLKRLIEHFVIVTDFEATNHMYATNLAIVFGPTLLQPAAGPASFATTMSNLGHHQTIVKYLILHFHYLFDIEGEETGNVDDD